MAKQTRPSSKPIPIRFTEQMLADIGAAANDLDLSQQDVIRLSVAAGLKALQVMGYTGIANAIAENVDKEELEKQLPEKATRRKKLAAIAPNTVAFPEPTEYSPQRVAEEPRVAAILPFFIDQRGGIAAGSPISGNVEWAPIPVAKEYPDDHYALQVFGESMAPKIPDGSTIIVQEWDRTRTPKKGTIVVYSDASGSTLKEFGYRAPTSKDDPEIINSVGKVAVLRSLNPAFKEVQTMEGGRIDAVFVELA